MTNPYTWTDDPTKVSVATCDPDILNEALMYLKWAADNAVSIPLGSQVLYSSAGTNGSGLIAQDNSSVSRITYAGLYNIIKLFYGLTCTFDASTTPIVYQTSANSGGYTSSGSSNYSGAHYPWEAFANGGNGWLSLAGSYSRNEYLQLAKNTGTFMPFGFSFSAYGGIATTGLNNGYISGNAGAGDEKLLTFEGKTYSGTAFTSLGAPSFLKEFNSVKIFGYNAAGSAEYMGGLFHIFPADFSSGIIKCVGHPYNTGDAVTVWEQNNNLPSGFTEGTVYYVRKIDADHFTLHPTATDATNNTNIIIPTNYGSGTFKVWKSTEFPVGNITGGYLIR